ncbi:MAG: MotA/TolQ/ExbB proton channel family protein [Bacteroidales bacterium]|nr:MotA/TolQ/ExbB proton channel family protein [Bacteroidales bacterium]MBO7647319.1 MotA/TolQ/ExbB proton channel family protein [Bacteroidales bacterium]
MQISLLMAQAAEAVEVAASQPQVKETTYFDLVFAKNSLWIMIPLFLMLAFAIYLFVKKMIVLNRASKEEHNFMNNIRDFIHDGKLDSAVALCKGNDTPTARLIEKGLSRIGHPLEDIRTAIENEGNLEVERLEKGVSAVATIAAIAPMLGFLGTVVGMVSAFHAMAADPNNFNIGTLSNGIYTAMITTVAGLIVGVIALVLHNFIVSRISNVVYLLEVRTTEFMDLLHENA